MAEWIIEIKDGFPNLKKMTPLVRCKDCKHNSLNRVSGNAFCNLGVGLSQIYDFCSHGERREER